MYQKLPSSWLNRGKTKTSPNAIHAFVLLLALHAPSLRICAFAPLCLCAFLYAQTPNYIETTTKNVDGNGRDVVDRSYSDGLGREIQAQTRINHVGNGVTKDIVAGTQYDDGGRPAKSVTPFVYERDLSESLDFIYDDLIWGTNCAYDYYTFDPDVGDFPYSGTDYFEDPLSVAKATGAPGTAFSTEEYNGGHPIKTWQFGVTGSTGALYFDSDGFISSQFLFGGDDYLNNAIPDFLSVEANRDPASLKYYLTVTKDQNGNFTQVLKDIFGNTIRTWAKAGIDPYNSDDIIVSKSSYNIFGNTVEEIPPQTTPNVDPTHYTYNSLGQLIEKTSPDGGTAQYWYDDAGRLDSYEDQAHAQRPGICEKKIKYDYDALGRNTTISVLDVPPADENVSVPDKDVRIRTIYDDPEAVRPFLENSTFSVNQPASQYPLSLNDIIAGLSNTQGRTVATIAYQENGCKMLTQDDEFTAWQKVTDLYSYDDEGRIAIEYKLLPRKGVEIQIINYAYDLQGKIASKTITYSSGAPAITYSYNYDVNGQVLNIMEGSKTFATYTYDDFGRIIHKEFGEPGKKRISYEYNIRNWVKRVFTETYNSVTGAWDEDAKFNEALTYNQDETTGPFNGNISRSQINTALTPGANNPGASLDLNYTYDGVDRLTKIHNSANDNPGEFDDNYDASFMYLNDGRILHKNEGIAQKEWGDYVYADGTNELKGITNSVREVLNP
jgi:YD repeat-containing protein